MFLHSIDIFLLGIMILHDISYSHTDLELLIRSNLIKPQGRKKMCLTKYVLSRQFSGTCVTQNSDYHLRYELCFIIYVRKHKKFTINSVPGIESFKMIIMMLRKDKNETSRLI